MITPETAEEIAKELITAAESNCSPPLFCYPSHISEWHPASGLPERACPSPRPLLSQRKFQIFAIVFAPILGSPKCLLCFYGSNSLRIMQGQRSQGYSVFEDSDKRPFSGGPKADFPLHARWLSDDDQRVCFHGKVIARIRGHRNKKSAAPQARLGVSALFYSWCIAQFCAMRFMTCFENR